MQYTVVCILQDVRALTVRLSEVEADAKVEQQGLKSQIADLRMQLQDAQIDFTHLHDRFGSVPMAAYMN